MITKLLITATAALLLPLQAQEHSAIIPVHRNNEGWWAKKNKELNQLATQKKHQTIFIGDSITHYWDRDGKELWKQYYEPRKSLNLGVSGDRTQHVIWRLLNGNLNNQEDAKLVIIMIGTNNTGHTEQAPEETAEGIKRINELVKIACPKAKILLLGVFPRAFKPDDKKRKINEGINTLISKFHDGERVHYLDIGSKFLNSDGSLNRKLVPDALHPKKRGYQIWAEAMEEKLKELEK